VTVDERFAVIQSGFNGDIATAQAGLSSSQADVRASALRSLHRLNELTSEQLQIAIADTASEVRRTAAEFAAPFHDVSIHHLIDDADVFVAEMAAWSLGERVPVTDEELQHLIDRTTSHEEPVVREACAAALGSIGDERGLPAILQACEDKPAVRRRAVLALAPFEGEEVDAALQKALEDRDWQVRQNAEILIHPRD
jgi:HEAT repeat protein